MDVDVNYTNPKTTVAYLVTESPGSSSCPKNLNSGQFNKQQEVSTMYHVRGCLKVMMRKQELNQLVFSH
jgi:hypothetical protein